MGHNRTGMPAVLAILVCIVTACSPFETPAVPTPVASIAPAGIIPTPTAPTAPATMIPTPAPSMTPAAVEGQDDLNCPIGTITACETQTVHLAISLTGAPFNLYYASDRVPGRASQHPWDVRSQGLGGWTFNVHHAYDPKSETLYLGNGDRHQIEKPVLLTGSSAGDILIAATDATEIYHFNADGRHLRTLDALTGAVRYAFSYDENGKLVSIKDRDGNVTTIERSGNGVPTGIRDPAGHRTTLRIDENGYLTEVVNPANESIKLEYTPTGLLITYTDSEGNASQFSYDGQGRLGHAELPDGIGSTLSRADTPGGYTITLTSSLGRITTYAVERVSDDTMRWVWTDPSGARTEELIGDDGSRKVILSDGSRVGVQLGADPRWGMQAPILKRLTQTTPSGLTTTIMAERTVALAKPDDLLSLQSLIEQLKIGERTFTNQYDATSRTLKTISPAGRESIVTLDAQGRMTSEQAADFLPASFSYDQRGRLTTLAQGTSADARTSAITYGDDQGSLEITDALGQAQQWRFDTAGRLAQVILSDK